MDAEAGEGGVAAACSDPLKNPLAVAAPLVKAEGGRGAEAEPGRTTLSRGASGGMSSSWGDSPLASRALGAVGAAADCKDAEERGMLEEQ